MKFGHLHAHTTYSALDGYGTAEQWAAHVKAQGFAAHAITDHGNVCAHAPFAKVFAKSDVKLVYGLEAYVVDDLEVKERAVRSLGAHGIPHVTLLALNGPGYEALLRLHNEAWQAFWHKPRTTWERIAGHVSRAKGGLIVLSGCPLGYPSQMVLNQGPEAARDWLEMWSGRLDGNLYVELVPSPGLDLSYKSLSWLALIAQELALPTILTSDAHFPSRADYEAEDALLAVGTGQPMVSADRKIRLGEEYHACTRLALASRLRQTVDQGDVPYERIKPALMNALGNIERIIDLAEVELPKAKMVAFPGASNANSSLAILRDWALTGLRRRKKERALPASGYREQDYHARLDLELEVLSSKGFCDYMLIVIDLILAMRRLGALVITRGSAGGSLLLWLCGASVTDPLRHDLLFERFFDETRDDAPDVDIDFSEAWRPRAMDYLRGKYGEECCAQIANFNTMGAKSAIKDAAFALGAPRDEAEMIAKALTSASDDIAGQLEVSPADVIAAVNRRPRLVPLAVKMVGQIKNQGIHAAGMLVAPEELDGKVGLMRGAGQQVVACLDKRGAKQLGYLKIDVLGVRTLDVIESVLKMIGKTPEWLETLPLDDVKALGLAKKSWLTGIFQLDGAAAARVSAQIGLDTFNDIAMASALCRPGPGDWVPMYAKFKSHPRLFRAHCFGQHATFVGIVEPTFGLVATQEQVMQMAWKLAGWSNKEVHQLRRDISDKKALDPDLDARRAWKEDNLNRWRNGVVRTLGAEWGEQANQWWETIQTHGGYSFNKSHCWTYAIVGYWMLYLKAHYPSAFYLAYLQVEPDHIVQKRLLREFIKAVGGKIRMLGDSDNFHQVDRVTIAGGLTNLKGVGAATAAKARVKLTPGLKHKIQLAQVDASAALQIAPWYPVQAMPSGADDVRARRGCTLLRHVLASEEEDEMTVLAYVTDTFFKPNHIGLYLEDETEWLEARVSKKNLAGLGKEVRQFKQGQLVMVHGWWSGSNLFISAISLVKEATDIRLPKKGKDTNG